MALGLDIGLGTLYCNTVKCTTVLEGDAVRSYPISLLLILLDWLDWLDWRAPWAGEPEPPDGTGSQAEPQAEAAPGLCTLFLQVGRAGSLGGSLLIQIPGTPFGCALDFLLPVPAQTAGRQPDR